MKQLKDYKEEIHRCSKCGICQHACPVYQETGNDCTVSRGLFIMLDGVINGDLKLNKNINKYLDLCLKCGKCKSACPTGIDVVDIILSAKHEYFKNSLEGKIYGFLESKLVFNTALNIIGWLRGIGRNGKLARHCEAHSAVAIQSEEGKKRAKAVYFGGCIEKLHPEVRDYVRELLHLMNIEVLDVEFGCCGMPFLSTGNLDRFEEQTRENLKKLEGLDFDYIITDCASCEFVINGKWKDYHLTPSPSPSREGDIQNCRSDLPSRQCDVSIQKNITVKSIYQLIAESGLEFTAKKKQVVTYHKPCHETGMEYINTIISRCHNVEFKELEGYDECCGFAGLEHPWSLKVISKIIKKKGNNIKKLNPDCVLTSCVGCIAGMGISTLFRKKIRRLITFLKDECKISSK